MGDIFGFYFNWGILLQIGCVIHFIRRRPNTYWLWIILMFGPLGSLAYILVEVIPDAGLLRGTLQVFPRRRRIRELERIIIDNPSSGNLEELADRYLEDGKPAKARELYDRAITPRTASIDPYISPRPRRARARRSARRRRRLLARRHRGPEIRLPPRRRPPRPRLRPARARTRTPRRGSSRRPRCPRLRSWRSTTPSSSSRPERPDEARQWAQRVLDKKATMPRYLARRERPWFRRAKAVMKRVQAGGTGSERAPATSG